MSRGVIQLYDDAWNATSSEARIRLLEQSLAPDAELMDPRGGLLRGREAIDRRIAAFGERFPGARVSITSGIDEHNGFARYAWSITDMEGKPILDGIDFVERAPDGLIQRVVMFFGELPSSKS